ncbi:MAG: hypothetical protein AAF658_01620, partial [Myxococcota bacterium]
MIKFEREGCKALENPGSERITSELKKLRSYGPSSFASITRETGEYLQVAGGAAGAFLEHRVGGKHYRAFQRDPVVPFEDGTKLEFTAGVVALNRNEWFQMKQVCEAFVAFAEGSPLPDLFQ